MYLTIPRIPPPTCGERYATVERRLTKVRPDIMQRGAFLALPLEKEMNLVLFPIMV
jgi:hypothetical protein